MANVEPCLNVHPRRWFWGEQALAAPTPPACRAPVAPRSVHGPCRPNHPASQLGTSWAQLCPFLWACFSLGLQIWPHGGTWTSEDIPRELKFSLASFNVAQVAVTNSCPFVCQTLSSGFFYNKASFELYFHLSGQRELHLLCRTGNRSSSSLSSAPLVTVLCLQGVEPCRTKGSGCCVFSACIGRYFRNSGRGVTLI